MVALLAASRAVDYTVAPGGVLRSRTVTNPPSIWASPVFQNGYLPAPLASADVQFRKLTAHPFINPTGLGRSPRRRPLRPVGERPGSGRFRGARVCHLRRPGADWIDLYQVHRHDAC
ncbi:MAG: hypothetical protein ACRDNT_02085 [Streptosporangiaceae bacterium]